MADRPSLELAPAVVSEDESLTLIQHRLGTIARALGDARGYVLTLQDNGLVWAEYIALGVDGIPLAAPVLQHINDHAALSFAQKGREPVQMHLDNLPDVSVLAVPLLVEDHYAGAVVFQRNGPAFDQGQIALLPFAIEPLAAQIALRRDRVGARPIPLLSQDFDRIARITSNYVVVTDTDLCVTWVNKAFEARSGWALHEIVGKNIEDLVRCPERCPTDQVDLRKSTESGGKFHGENVNQDRDGNLYWLTYDVLPLFGPSGEVTGYVSIETDITRLKELEAEVTRQARTAHTALSRLENAISAMPDGVMIVDTDGIIVSVNNQLRAMFPQLSAYAVPGMPFHSLLEKAAASKIFPDWLDNYLAPPSEDGSPAPQTDWQSINELTMHDGRSIRWRVLPTSDNGQLFAFTDLTAHTAQMAALDAANLELKQALEARKRAKRRAARIIDNSGIGTWEWSFETGTIRIGGRWAEMLGYTAEELEPLTHEKFQSLLHPEDAAKLDVERPRDLSQGDLPFEGRFRMQHRNGAWLNILSRGKVVQRDEDCTPVLVTGVHLDMTQQAELEHQLSEERAMLKMVLETSVTAIAVIDEKGALIFANEEAEAVLHLDRSEIEGRKFDDPVWKNERVQGGPLPDDEIPVGVVFKTGKPVRDARHAIAWPDGSRRILSVNAAPIHLADGKINVVASFVDLTDELNATERLEDARRRAEESNKTKSMFLANMSHEIRTPLNGVLGMAEVLQGSITNPDHLRMIETIRTSGETLLTVLNGILDMSKIEAGKMELEALPFVPLNLLRYTDTVFSVQAEETGIDFEVTSSVGANRTMIGDLHRIQQILNNLLNNAFKFTEKGRITLKLSCPIGSPMSFEVSDTGLGMPEAQAARVFESFVQADGSMTRRYGGTGLGLSIVKELVTLMGGTITLKSVEGKGTTVVVTLPLAEAEAGVTGVTTLPGEEVSETALAGCRVLIADDNMTNRLVLTEMLESCGAVIEGTENGRQAVDLWTKKRNGPAAFQVLLLDITMPVLDGLGAIRLIRDAEAASGHAEVPAVAITANAMPHQVSEYIIGGFDSHLSKPFRKRDLLQAIRSLLIR